MSGAGLMTQAWWCHLNSSGEPSMSRRSTGQALKKATISCLSANLPNKAGHYTPLIESSPQFEATGFPVYYTILHYAIYYAKVARYYRPPAFYVAGMAPARRPPNSAKLNEAPLQTSGSPKYCKGLLQFLPMLYPAWSHMSHGQYFFNKA